MMTLIAYCQAPGKHFSPVKIQGTGIYGTPYSMISTPDGYIEYSKYMFLEFLEGENSSCPCGKFVCFFLFYFLFLWIYVQQANYVLRRTGGVRPHISRSDVREINVWEGMVQLKEHIYWKSLMYMVQ
jgi:hypothetical protein